MARVKAAGATSASFPRMSWLGIDGNCRRHLVFVICGEPVPRCWRYSGLDADRLLRQAGSRDRPWRRSFRPGIPPRRGGADLFDDDAAARPAIFDGASPRRIEVDPVGLCRDGDERRGLRLAPRRFGLV